MTEIPTDRDVAIGTAGALAAQSAAKGRQIPRADAWGTP
jgi:hypothetical protein